jgi:hypothetical protein
MPSRIFWTAFSAALARWSRGREKISSAAGNWFRSTAISTSASPMLPMSPSLNDWEFIAS